MKLTTNQINQYNQNGYLKIPNYFTDNELEILCSELPKTIEENSPRIIFEDNGSVRSVFAPHLVNHTYNKLSRLERLVIPSEQLIGDKVYLHQFKINTKKGLKGDWWEWHQDFPYWYIDDRIKKPEIVNIMIYLQNTNSANGALLFIPKSHKSGIAKFADKKIPLHDKKSESNNLHKDEDYLSSLNSDIKFTIDPNLIKELATKNGILTFSGKKGTVLFFHPNLFHASNINLSPFDRDAILITYNSINNLPQNIDNPRPEFLAGRDYNPINNLVITL